MKYILIAGLFITALASCDNNSTVHKQNEDKPNIYITPSEDKEMNDAILKAKNTFSIFDSAFSSNKFDTGNFSIKVRFPTNDGGAEHIWVTSLIKKDGEYFGVIDDLPELTTKVKVGDKIKIKKNDISDWMYGDKGILYGGYTIKVIRSRLTKEEQAKFDSGFSFKIVD